eukprot:4680672-Amphidinium_carterae.1
MTSWDAQKNWSPPNTSASISHPGTTSLVTTKKYGKIVTTRITSTTCDGGRCGRNDHRSRVKNLRSLPARHKTLRPMDKQIFQM